MRNARLFRHVALWNIPVWLRYQPRRVRCSRCGGVRTEQLPWATGKQRLTRAYSCFLAKWAELLLWHSVAKLFGCAWRTIATALKSVVKYGMEHRDLSGVTHIGIDEISRKKGQAYLTNVYDLRSKTLLDLEWGLNGPRIPCTAFSSISGWSGQASFRASAAICGSPMSR